MKACYVNFECKGAVTALHVVDKEFNDSEDSDDEVDESDGRLETTVSLEDIEKGKYQLVYAHPEALISTRRGRKLMASIAKKVSVVAIDEGHMIMEWYIYIICLQYKYRNCPPANPQPVFKEN